MLISDIQFQEGRTECFDTSLGLLALPPIEFALNKDSYKEFNSGKIPELPGPILEDKSNVTP